MHCYLNTSKCQLKQTLIVIDHKFVELDFQQKKFTKDYKCGLRLPFVVLIVPQHRSYLNTYHIFSRSCLKHVVLKMSESRILI